MAKQSADLLLKDRSVDEVAFETEAIVA